MKLILSKKFEEDYAKLVRRGSKYREKVHKTFEYLLEDIHHPSLRLHKLKNKNTHSVSVDMKIRIILEIEKDMIFLMKIGNHDEIYRD